MDIPVFSSAGEKKGTWSLPASIFEAPINRGLMHQAVVMQQSNRRSAIAHAKHRGEVVGSTRKVYAQKHTGRARRGAIRSPLLRGGGKAFGPRNERNFRKEMPRGMRHAALRACLSLQARNGAIMGLEGYDGKIKTKDMIQLLGKMPVDLGRKILLVLPAKQESIVLSSRNIPGVRSILASYLNARDVLNSRHLIFLQGAVEKAEEIFAAGKKVKTKTKVVSAETETVAKPRKTVKKAKTSKVSSSK